MFTNTFSDFYSAVQTKPHSNSRRFTSVVWLVKRHCNSGKSRNVCLVAI